MELTAHVAFLAGSVFEERVDPMAVRGIRGATSVAVDEKSEVLAATRELLVELLRVNGLYNHPRSHVSLSSRGRSINGNEFGATAVRVGDSGSG